MCMIENAGDPVKWLSEEGRCRGRDVARHYRPVMPLRNCVFLHAYRAIFREFAECFLFE